jgi:hypothetical protein
MLGATLNDSAGYVYFTGDKERGLEMNRRACEIFSQIDSPNWYGHALMLRGMLLKLEGAPDEAKDHFVESAGLLDLVGDVNCWANSTRGLVRCEVALGDSTSAAAHLLEVLERMPTLPMHEIAKPRTLDAIADTLIAAGQYDDGGVLLGTALVTPFPAESVMRPAELEEIRSKAVELLGAAEAERLFEAGAELDLDEALERGRRLLVKLASDGDRMPAAPRLDPDP